MLIVKFWESLHGATYNYIVSVPVVKLLQPESPCCFQLGDEVAGNVSGEESIDAAEEAATDEDCRGIAIAFNKLGSIHLHLHYSRIHSQTW